MKWIDMRMAVLLILMMWLCPVEMEAGGVRGKDGFVGDDGGVKLEGLVNPWVGTDNASTGTAGMFGKGSEEMGQTLPAVLEPNGMNFWTPQTQDTEVKCKAPYYYKDERLQGFRASHWIVGGCTQDYGSVTLMPLCSPVFMPEARASRFSHVEEVCRPSYYGVRLKDSHIFAEMTGRSHSAIFRFTFPQDSAMYLTVNPNSDEGEGYVEVIPEKHQIRGYNPAHRIYQGKGEACGFSGYFIIQLPEDAVWEAYGTYHADSIFEHRRVEKNKVIIGAYLRVANTGKPLMVKVATSFVDWEGCERNLKEEIPHWDFEQTRNELAGIWEKQLSKIRIKLRPGQDIRDARIFYTALYHASFLPREMSDVDGRYPSFGGGRAVMQMERGRKYYDDFSTWDTYRALHPLLTLISPDKSADMMQSLVLKYEQGGWLPVFPCWNSYTSAMIGDHCISLLADAYVKGVRGFDIEKAYEAMRKNAFDAPASYEEYASGMGRRALESYLKYGYIPLEDSVKEAYHKQEQVSRTLEYAYDDFCLAQVAKMLGHKDDYKVLMARSKNYRHVISPTTGYALGRHSDGSFSQDTDPVKFQKFVTEGAPCHYTFYVPHDVKGLIKAMGGKKAFEMRLDSLFDEHRYWHGNEPCHQIPFLYAYIGQTGKLQERVNHILATEYADSPGGLSGNDDAGQMSAWYIFASMGMYPVCPGTKAYVRFRPLFEEVEIGGGS